MSCSQKGRGDAAEICLDTAQLHQALSLPGLLHRCVSVHKHVFPLFIHTCTLLQKTKIVLMQQSISSARLQASPSGELQGEAEAWALPGDADCLLAAENKCKVPHSTNNSLLPLFIVLTLTEV